MAVGVNMRVPVFMADPRATHPNSVPQPIYRAGFEPLDDFIKFARTVYGDNIDVYFVKDGEEEVLYPDRFVTISQLVNDGDGKALKIFVYHRGKKRPLPDSFDEPQQTVDEESTVGDKEQITTTDDQLYASGDDDDDEDDHGFAITQQQQQQLLQQQHHQHQRFNLFQKCYDRASRYPRDSTLARTMATFSHYASKCSSVGMQIVAKLTEHLPPIDCGRGRGHAVKHSKGSCNIQNSPRPNMSPISGRKTYVGLVNQAATCYLNSMLQSLYMTPEFRNALYRWEYTGTDDESDRCIPYQLQRLFLRLQTSGKMAVETVGITRSFGWTSHDAWEQHDVQELCHKLFDALEETWKGTPQENVIRDLYLGKMTDSVKCAKCGKCRSHPVEYLDIQLPLKTATDSAVHGSIEEALSHFCKEELLQGTDQLYCDNCKSKCDAVKALKFLTFPYLLTIHLMRFDYNLNIGARIKLNHKVKFPFVLDLTRFLSTSDSAGSSSDDEDEPMLSDDEEEVDREEISSDQAKYELFSVLVHSGSATGGHYYAFIKDFQTGQWYDFDDCFVKEMAERGVELVFGGDSDLTARNTNAYMLMYRRIDKQRNAAAMVVSEFPDHLHLALSRMKENDLVEEKEKETRRTHLHVRLFYDRVTEDGHVTLCDHDLGMVSRKTMLTDLAREAYKHFHLEDAGIHFDRVRLVRFNSEERLIVDTFSNGVCIGAGIGMFCHGSNVDLLLDVKPSSGYFSKYCTEYFQLSCKIRLSVVDVASNDLLIQRAFCVDWSMLFSELKQIIANQFSCDVNRLCCAIKSPISGNDHDSQRPCTVLWRLTEGDRCIRIFGFQLKSINEVFVEMNCKELGVVDFTQTRLYKWVDFFLNSCKVKLALRHPIMPLMRSLEGQGCSSGQVNEKEMKQLCAVAAAGASAFVGVQNPVPASAKCALTAGARDVETEPQHLPKNGLPVNTAVRSEADDAAIPMDVDNEGVEPVTRTTRGQSGVGQLSLASESRDVSQSTGTLPIASRVEMLKNDVDFRSTLRLDQFACHIVVLKEIDEQQVLIKVDKRMKGRSLRQWIAKCLNVSEHLLEIDLLANLSFGSYVRPLVNDANGVLQMLTNDMEIAVRIGPELKADEVRVHVYQLLLSFANTTRPFHEFVMRCTLKVGTAVGEFKQQLIDDWNSAKNSTRTIDLERLRVREKTMTGPGQIYSSSMTFGNNGIQLKNDMDIYVEVLPDSDKGQPGGENGQRSIYVRRFRPQKYQLDRIVEVCVDEDSATDLQLGVAKACGIAVENLEMAKIDKNVRFPFRLSVFGCSGMDWQPVYRGIFTLRAAPFSCRTDGCAFLCKDKTENWASLSQYEKDSILKNERSRKVGNYGVCDPVAAQAGLEIRVKPSSAVKSTSPKVPADVEEASDDKSTL